MKIIPKKAPAVHPILQLYRNLPWPEKLPTLTNLAGSYNAKMLLLCDHPTPDEFTANVPFCGDAAQNYMNAVASTERIDPRSDFLIVPHSRFGKKANKASTLHTFDFVKELLLISKIQCVVCTGITSFGFTFAGGRRTHARSVIGNPMFLPQIYTVPVFVMHDTQFILPDPQSFRDVRFARDRLQAIANLTINLANFMEQLKPNALLEKLRQEKNLNQSGKL